VRFPGIIPAVTTPFDAVGEVDGDALRENVSALLGAGVHGLVATGTMGEAGSLTTRERRMVIAAVVDAADGRVPVIAGVSSHNPVTSVAYATDAEDAGADAVMLLPPLLYPGDEAEIEAFYATVATGTRLPIMAYNNPAASGTDMSPAFIARLFDRVGRVVAIKECSADARRLPALLHAAPGLEVLVGGDDWALEGFCAGATGWVTGVGDVAPRECVELWELCRAGDLDAARAVYGRLLPLARLDMTPKLVQYFKAALDAVGLAGGPTRPPRLPLTEEEAARLADALAVLKAEVPV
jgi:dihydrodipicolinate synthase/N-acetylneuraminate lyase